MNSIATSIRARLTITFGFVTLLAFVLLFVSYQAINNITNRWDQFHTGSLEKYTAASKGEADLGNAIHHFKNYLLRGQDYDQKFMADMAAIERDAASYANNHGEMNEREKSALQQIKQSSDAYRAAIKEAVEMKASGKTIEEIDKTIKGADQPLGKAFDELLMVVQEESGATALSISSAAVRGKQEALAIGLMVALMAFILGAWITRNILLQIGGEPVYVAEVVKRIADGDLTVQVDTKSNDSGSVLYGVKDMVSKIADIVVEVRNATDTIITTSNEISAGNSELSQRTEHQAANLEETASSMEELTSTVQQNAENARHASQLATNASDIAVKGGQVVNEVVDTMASISTSSKKIVDIISVIEGIAFQTNILALNAAVEAARAGEQGRGFAVVASEVRSLAQRSAAAAKEIKTLIDDSVSKVESGSRQVDQAGATMSEVVQAVKRVTDIMAEISAASSEQSSGIEEVNQAIVQMDGTTQQNAALVEEAAAASESMQQQAEALYAAVGVFRVVGGKEAALELAAKMTALNAGRLDVAHRLPANDSAAPVRNVRQLAGKVQKNKDGDWKEF